MNMTVTAMTVNRKKGKKFPMIEPAYKTQAAELKHLLSRSHLSEAELAARAHIKEETLRKYVGGYQKCGRQTLVAIRNVVQFEMARMESAAGHVEGGQELREQVIAYAGKLLRLPEEKLDLAKRLIDELHGPPEPSSDVEGEARKILDAAEQQADSPPAAAPGPGPASKGSGAGRRRGVSPGSKFSTGE